MGRRVAGGGVERQLAGERIASARVVELAEAARARDVLDQVPAGFLRERPALQRKRLAGAEGEGAALVSCEPVKDVLGVDVHGAVCCW